MPETLQPEIARLTSVAKLFGTFAALRPLSLTLQPGKIYLVLGENGAGKSTLLRLLAGLAEPSQGNVEIFGAPPSAARGRIAYMAHASTLYDELTALENLNYFATLHKMDGGCDCTGSPEMALRAVSLDPKLKRPVAQYSQGMRQRASLARALQSDPELLLLDEPFSNLDVASAQSIVDLLADFRTWPHPLSPAGRTIVLTTHQAHLVKPIADEILTLNAGVLTRENRSRESTNPGAPPSRS
jgi:ABC-type multidrug transport system ATPase subunit